MKEACPLLLEQHSSDGTIAGSRLPVAIEGYGPLVQNRIVVVRDEPRSSSSLRGKSHYDGSIKQWLDQFHVLL
jgi:hypothetical protein